MYPNLLFLPTLLGALFLARVGFWTASVRRPTPHLKALLALAGVLAMPALLFVVYYAHLLDRAAWFYAFRAAPYSELTASGLGFGAGLLAGLLRRALPALPSLKRNALISALGLVSLGVLFVPYLKPFIAPIRTPVHDKWSQGVCLQTPPSTCGPASAVTLLRQFQVQTNESQLARECFSYRGGTENWYVAGMLPEPCDGAG